MRIIYLMPLLLLIACADLTSRDEKQRIQTKVNEALSLQSKNISSCLKEHQLFKYFNKTRLRIDVHMRISDQGKLEKFSLENDKDYPTEFVDCLFNVLDKTKFPSLKEGETLELSQPFIFKS